MNCEFNYIRNIHKAKWIQTMSYHPKNILQFTFLVSILDHANIFSEYDMRTIETMKHKNLNAAYGILRISNSSFTTLCEKNNENFAGSIENYLSSYEIDDMCLLDQITQDFNHFITSNTHNILSGHMNNCLLSDLVVFFNKTLSNKFYKSSGLDASNFVNFIKGRDFQAVFECIVSQILGFFNDTRLKFCPLLNKIFEFSHSNRIGKKIMSQLDELYDVVDIINDQCFELDLFYEKMIDDAQMMSVKEINELANVYGYNVKHCGSSDILQPFIDHNFINSKKKFVGALIKIFSIKNGHDVGVRQQYETEVVYKGNARNISFDSFLKIMKSTKKIPDDPPILAIYGFLGKFFNANLCLITDSHEIIPIKNNSFHDSVFILKNRNNYYTLYSSDVFKPINSKVKAIDYYTDCYLLSHKQKQYSPNIFNNKNLD